MPRRRSRARERTESKFSNRARTSSQSSVEIQVTQNDSYASSTTTVSISTGVTAPTGPLVLPSVGFSDVLKKVGARGENSPQGELFTLKQLCYYLKEYIKSRSLYDPLDPVKVYCRNDPLRHVFGVDNFTLSDAIDLVKKATKTVDLDSRPTHTSHGTSGRHSGRRGRRHGSRSEGTPAPQAAFPQLPQISIMDALMGYPSGREGYQGSVPGRESPTPTPQPEADPSVSSTTITPKLGQLPPDREEATSEDDDVIPPTQAPAPRAALFRDVNGNSRHHLFTQDSMTSQRRAETPTNQSTAHTLTNEMIAHTPTNQTIAHTLTNQSTGHTLTNQTAAHTLTNQSTGHTLTNQRTAHILTNQSTGHTLTNQRTAHTLTNQRTAHTLTNQTAAHTLTNQRTAHTQSSLNDLENRCVQSDPSQPGANKAANHRAGLHDNHGNSSMTASQNLCNNVLNNNVVTHPTILDNAGIVAEVLDNAAPTTSLTGKHTATTATQSVINDKNNDGEGKKSRKRKRKKHSSTCSTDSHPGEDVADGDYTVLRQRGSSLSIITYPSEGEGDGQPWSLRVEWQDSEEGSDESVLSVQSKETVLVKDSSDDYWFLTDEEISVEIEETTEGYQPYLGSQDDPTGYYPGDHGNPRFAEEYEVLSESSVTQDQETDSDESDSPIEEIIVVCAESDMDCWADSESSEAEDDSSDEDIRDEDKWQCSRCDSRNSPVRRFCDLCMTLREGWVAVKKSHSRGSARSRYRRSEERLHQGGSQESGTSQGASQVSGTSHLASQESVTSQLASQESVTSQGTSQETVTSQQASQTLVTSQAGENNPIKSTEACGSRGLSLEPKSRSPRKPLLSQRVRLLSTGASSPRKPPRFYTSSDAQSPRRLSSVLSPRRSMSPRVRSPWRRPGGQEEVFQFPSTPLPVDVSFPLESGSRSGSHSARNRSFSWSDGQPPVATKTLATKAMATKTLAIGLTAIKNLSFTEQDSPSHSSDSQPQDNLSASQQGAPPHRLSTSPQGEDDVFEIGGAVKGFRSDSGLGTSVGWHRRDLEKAHLKETPARALVHPATSTPPLSVRLSDLSGRDSGLGGSQGWGSDRTQGTPLDPPQGSQLPNPSSQDSAIEADQSFTCSPTIPLCTDGPGNSQHHRLSLNTPLCMDNPGHKQHSNLPADHLFPTQAHTQGCDKAGNSKAPVTATEIPHTGSKQSPGPSRTKPRPLTLSALASPWGPHSPLPGGSRSPHPGGYHPQGRTGGLQVPFSYPVPPSPGVPHSYPLVPPSPRKRTASGTEYNDLCVICLSRPKDASVIHGKTGHQVACYPCAKRLRRRGKACPVCRRPIQKVIRNYLV